MAAEGLEKAAKKAGCTIKIETRGSAGAKNVLTDEDIEKAECIIVAADAKVPMARFEGHKVIECQVSDGINKADELISQALSGDVPNIRYRGWADLLMIVRHLWLRRINQAELDIRYIHSL